MVIGCLLLWGWKQINTLKFTPSLRDLTKGGLCNCGRSAWMEGRWGGMQSAGLAQGGCWRKRKKPLSWTGDMSTPGQHSFLSTWHWAKYITCCLSNAMITSSVSQDTQHQLWAGILNWNPQPGSSQCVQLAASVTPTLDDWGSFLAHRVPVELLYSHAIQLSGFGSPNPSVTFSYHCFMEDTTLLSLYYIPLLTYLRETVTTCLRLCAVVYFMSSVWSY